MTSLVTGSALALLAGALLRIGPAARAGAGAASGKPIRLIVGLAAGGGTDVMARLVAQKMSESMRHDRAGREQGRRQLHPGAARAHRLAARRPHALLHLDQLADHPAAAPGLSVRPHQAHAGHPGRDRAADPGGAQRPRRQDACAS